MKNCTFSEIILYNNYFLLPPSQLVECTRQISITDIGEFIKFIKSMNQIFLDNYAFYNSSTDVTLNQPLKYQPHLGYDIYHGSQLEGQVNITQELQKIIHYAVQNGADATLFWNISNVFEETRDGHVDLTTGPLGQLTTTIFGSETRIQLYFKSVFDHYFEQGYLNYYKTKFFIENSQLQLELQVVDGKTNSFISKQRVKLINNQTPFEFLSNVANQTCYELKNGINRMNLAMEDFSSDSYYHFIYSIGMLHSIVLTYPTSLFPDEFEIEFVSDSNSTETKKEKVLSFVYVSHGDLQPYILEPLLDLHYNWTFTDQDYISYETLVLDVQKLTNDFNKEGKYHRDIIGTVKETEDELDACLSTTTPTNNPTRRDRRRKLTLERHELSHWEKIKKRKEQYSNERQSIHIDLDDVYDDNDDFIKKDDYFEGIFLKCPYDAAYFSNVLWKYKIIPNEYTILKIPSFDECYDWNYYTNYTFFFTQFTNAWKLLLENSMTQNSHKLLVDVSRNNGGMTYVGLSLALLMYPHVNYEYFVTIDNIPYNAAMHQFQSSIMPLLQQEFSQDQKKAFLQTLTDAQYCLIETIAFVYEDMYDGYIIHPKTNRTLEEISLLLSEKRTVYHLDEFLQLINIHAIDYYNPWNVAGGSYILQNLTAINTTVQTLIRGGVFAQFITGNDLIYESVFDIMHDFGKSLPHKFDEYMIVSNGFCVSTCDIFVSTLLQLWRNRNITKADTPLSIVTYGPSSQHFVDPAQFAGGFVANARVVDIYGPLPALFFYYILTRDSIYWNEFNAYLKSIGDVPFYLNQFPRLPVSEGINGLMMDSGIPIEYLKKNPDFYIQQVWNEIDYWNNHDSQSLYDTTSQFFGVIDVQDNDQESAGGSHTGEGIDAEDYPTSSSCGRFELFDRIAFSYICVLVVFLLC